MSAASSRQAAISAVSSPSGSGLRPSTRMRGENASASATATSAVIPRAPPLITTSSSRPMIRLGPVTAPVRVIGESSSPTGPSGSRPTSDGPRVSSSSTIQRAAWSGDGPPSPRSSALQSTRGHSRPAVLDSPASAPEAGSISGQSPSMPNRPSSRATLSNAAPRRCPARSSAGPAARIVRKAALTNPSGTRPAGARTIRPPRSSHAAG